MAAASALAVAVPAAAHPAGSHHHGGAEHHIGAAHPSRSRRCRPHNVAYVEAGTVDSTAPSTLARNSDGTWSGTLVVDVTHTNHWAKANSGTTVSYTFSNANLRVRFDGGATGFTAGEPVKLIGKLATVAKTCTAHSPAVAPVFRAVVVHPATS